MTTLLTGATGFLGSRLCAALLRRTDQEIVCVVRANSAEQAEERVRGLLRDQDPAVAASRALRCVPGDLIRSGLGMDGPVYGDLCRTVEEVYHCGASVNMAAPYEHLAPVNVGATTRVVEFCRRGRAKRLHHVSTLGVFLAGRACGHREVRETTAPSPLTCGPIGYPRSKLDAEAVVDQAAADGLPVTVYRPGLVLADSRSGASPADDFVARLYAATVLTGCHPHSLSSIPVVPVDCAAEMIAELSLRPDADPGPFHIMLPKPLPAAELLGWARRFGYPLTEVTPEQWRAALKVHSHSRTALAMRVLAIGEHILGLSESSRLPHYRCDAAAPALRRLGWQERPLNADYFTAMFRSLIDRRILPPLPLP